MAASATLPSNTSPTANSSMSSPKDGKQSIAAPAKSEDTTKIVNSTQESQEPPTSAPTDKPTTSNAPLAPPPKPSSSSDAPDYFNTVHNPFSLEPNVFEQSFGNPSVETPGKTVLPPVANITSPSPLPGITPGWQSLRSGPLSPAMLTGPTGQQDYFSESFRGFPTPNESSLRTGLTPGGGGSMFPAPSPNAQAIFNLQSGGVTPSTADFHQSALRAAAQANQPKMPTTSAPAAQAETATAISQATNGQPQQQQEQPRANGQQDLFGQHDVSSAASDLLSFAQQNSNGNRNGAAYAIPNQTNQSNMGHMPVQPVTHDQNRRNTHGSLNSITGSADTGDLSDSNQSDQGKPNSRSRAGKNNTKAAANKRKTEAMPKVGNKKAKINNGAALSPEDEMSEDDIKEEGDMNNKKMTDEEKRKNFLERNRVAALKCRQRKKQWLANLQAKVELFSTENDALSATVTSLREEIVNLKTLLLAHKDCPVSAAQGLGGMSMQQFLGNEFAHHANPYGIAQMQPNGNVPMGIPMQQHPVQNR